MSIADRSRHDSPKVSLHEPRLGKFEAMKKWTPFLSILSFSLSFPFSLLSSPTSPPVWFRSILIAPTKFSKTWDPGIFTANFTPDTTVYPAISKLGFVNNLIIYMIAGRSNHPDNGLPMQSTALDTSSKINTHTHISIYMLIIPTGINLVDQHDKQEPSSIPRSPDLGPV